MPVLFLGLLLSLFGLQVVKDICMDLPIFINSAMQHAAIHHHTAASCAIMQCILVWACTAQLVMHLCSVSIALQQKCHAITHAMCPAVVLDVLDVPLTCVTPCCNHPSAVIQLGAASGAALHSTVVLNTTFIWSVIDSTA